MPVCPMGVEVEIADSLEIHLTCIAQWLREPDSEKVEGQGQHQKLVLWPPTCEEAWYVHTHRRKQAHTHTNMHSHIRNILINITLKDFCKNHNKLENEQKMKAPACLIRFLKATFLGTREITQWLWALASLPHVAASQLCISSPEGSGVLFWPLQALHAHGAQTYTQAKYQTNE